MVMLSSISSSVYGLLNPNVTPFSNLYVKFVSLGVITIFYGYLFTKLTFSVTLYANQKLLRHNSDL